MKWWSPARGSRWSSPCVAELSNLLHQLMQQQAGRDLQMRQESQWPDSRWNQIQYGYSQLQHEVHLEQQELQVLIEAATTWPHSLCTYTGDNRSSGWQSGEIPLLEESKNATIQWRWSQWTLFDDFLKEPQKERPQWPQDEWRFTWRHCWQVECALLMLPWTMTTLRRSWSFLDCSLSRSRLPPSQEPPAQILG